MAAPANDNVANAQVLTSGTQVSGSTIEATAESGEVKGTSDGASTASATGFRTVWFRWTAPSANTYAFTTDNSSFDTYLSVFSRTSGPNPATSVSNLTCFGSNDDGGSTSRASRIVIDAANNETIYFQVTGYGATDFGDYVFNYPTTSNPGPSSGTTANAGQAAVGADAYGPAAQSAVTITAGAAEVAAAANSPVAVVPHLFTTQTPTSADNSDGTPGITTATTVQFAIAGYITAVRWYCTSNNGGTWTGAVWQVDLGDSPGPGAGTLLASKTHPTAPTGGTWNLITLDTPVAVTPGVLYRIGVHSSDGRYVATGAFFGGTPLANGEITAHAGNADPIGLGAMKQGAFIIDASLTYPTASFNNTNYFVDVAFALEAPNGTTAAAGAANVVADAHGSTAQTVVAASAGQAAVGADAYATTTALTYTASAGFAAVTADGFNAAASG